MRSGNLHTMKSEVVILREVIDAERFMEIRRRKFPSLYPSTLAFFACSLMTSHDYGWDKNGLIIDGDNIDNCPDQITDDGWKSFKNADHIPTGWGDPCKASPLFCIPDNASKQWVEAISHFCYKIEKISVAQFKAYVTAKTRLGMMSKQYQDEYIERYVANFVKCKKLLKHYEVHERCNAIRNKQDGYVAPLPLKKGSVVRLQSGVSTATVVSDELTFGNGQVKGACYLDKPLGGTQYWNKSDLVVVSNPA